MATSKLRVLAGAAILVAGCAGHDDEEVTATTTGTLEPSSATPSEPSEPSEVYVALESCAAQAGGACTGGYWVREVNRAVGARLVAAFDVSRLPSQAMKQATGGGDELIFRGLFGRPEGPLGLRPFLALDAWRGLPGVQAPADDLYFAVETTADGAVASLLNGRQTRRIDAVAVPGAPAFVDTGWLTSRALQHGAIVAGGFDGSSLEAAQVFVHLPDSAGLCSTDRVLPLASIDREGCGSEEATFQRTDDMCLVSTGCVAPRPCPMIRPACDPGYVLSSWPTGPAGCLAFACDPAFLSM